METPTYFHTGSYNLYGVTHLPDIAKPDISLSKVEQKKVGVVFCHPFAEEKVISHRVMVNCARNLANAGIPVFRFDFMGHGDSEGNFEDATIETCLNDIHGAVQFFKNYSRVDEIVLLGLRFGATLAALYTCRDEILVDSIIMINPVINGRIYFKKTLRSNLATQMATYQKVLKKRDQLIEELRSGIPVNVDGYLLTYDLFVKMNDINLEELSLCNLKELLIIDVSKKNIIIYGKQYLSLQQKFLNEKRSAEIRRIQSESFWSDTKRYIAKVNQLHEVVLNWLDKIYSK